MTQWQLVLDDELKVVRCSQRAVGGWDDSPCMGGTSTTALGCATRAMTVPRAIEIDLVLRERRLDDSGGAGRKAIMLADLI